MGLHIFGELPFCDFCLVCQLQLFDLLSPSVRLDCALDMPLFDVIALGGEKVAVILDIGESYTKQV